MKKKYIIYVSSIVLLTVGLLLVTWRARAARLANTFAGILEVGNNQGFASAVFEQMMTDVGWRGGEAWCMYFAKAVYLAAFPNKAQKINKVLTGSTQGSWKNASASDTFKVITSGKPRQGDIIIWQSTSDASKGHAGIVLKKLSGNTYRTVEGNSGMGGTSEGDGVVNGTRILTPGITEGSLKLLGFIRLKTF